MRKSIIIGLATTAVALSATGILGVVNAATATSSQTIVDKLATKFNLKKADVQAVFDQNKVDMQAQHTANENARLQALVDKGIITADQKTKIEAKQKELAGTKTAAKADLEKWATDNKIDATYIVGHFGGRGHGGGVRMDGAMMGLGETPATTPKQ